MIVGHSLEAKGTKRPHYSSVATTSTSTTSCTGTGTGRTIKKSRTVDRKNSRDSGTNASCSGTTEGLTETQWDNVRDSENPLINKVRGLLGIQCKVGGLHRQEGMDAESKEKLATRRDQRYKREIMKEIKDRLGVISVSELELLEVLRWSQSQKAFPLLHNAASQGVDTEQLVHNIKHAMFRNCWQECPKPPYCAVDV